MRTAYRKKQLGSLKVKAVLMALLIQLPLIVLLMMWYTQAVNELREELIQTNITNARICAEKTSLSLKLASGQFMQYYQPMRHMNYQQTSPGRRVLYYISLQADLGTMVTDFNPVHTFFAYNHDDDYYVENRGGALGYEEHLELQVILQSQQLPYGKWTVYSLCNQDYLFYTLRIHNFTYGACVSWKDLMRYYLPALSGENSRLLLCDQQHIGPDNPGFSVEALGGAATAARGTNITSPEGTVYRVVRLHQEADFDYYLALEISQGRNGLYMLARNPILILIPLLMCLSSLALLYFFWHSTIRPIELIRFGFRQIKNNQLDFRMPESGYSTELNDMNRSFNSMVRRISELKVDVYEKQLEKEKYEQQWLLSNLRPHFILNNLTTIDNLVSARDWNGIHALVANLSDYLRNSIGAEFVEVTLEHSLKTAGSYLNLMQFLYPDSITYELHCQPDVIHLQFPPLILCVLCENAIKYGFAPPRPLHIEFDCRLVHKEDHLLLRITASNNGPHFSQEVCNDINFSASRPIQDSTHVGLQSVKRRLELIYANQCRLFVENHEDGVAVIIERIVDPKEVNTIEHSAGR